MNQYISVIKELRAIMENPDIGIRHQLADTWVRKYFRHVEVSHPVLNADKLGTVETQFLFDKLEQDLVSKASQDQLVKLAKEGSLFSAQILIVVPDSSVKPVIDKSRSTPRLIRKPQLKVLDGGKK
jgi:hypothetical protein